jgi:hypothetical protein
MTINADRCKQYRQTQSGQDALKRQVAKQALEREARHNSLKLDRRPGFEYKARDEVRLIKHCLFCGKEIPRKVDYPDYCGYEHYMAEFRRAYGKAK